VTVVRSCAIDIVLRADRPPVDDQPTNPVTTPMLRRHGRGLAHRSPRTDSAGPMPRDGPWMRRRVVIVSSTLSVSSVLTHTPRPRGRDPGSTGPSLSGTAPKVTREHLRPQRTSDALTLAPSRPVLPIYIPKKIINTYDRAVLFYTLCLEYYSSKPKLRKIWRVQSQSVLHSNHQILNNTNICILVRINTCILRARPQETSKTTYL